MQADETVTAGTPVPRLPQQRSGQHEVVVTFAIADDLSTTLPGAVRLAEERGVPLDLVLVHAADEPAARRLVALDLALHQVRELLPSLEVRVHEVTVRTGARNPTSDGPKIVESR